MLSALRHTDAPRGKLKINLPEGRVEEKPLPDGYRRLGKHELNDDISDLFAHLPPARMPATPFKSRNLDGSVFLGEAVLQRAEEMKAQAAAEAKLARAESRRQANAAKKAQGLPCRAPAKTKTLRGREIPAQIRGRVTITGTMQASTGEALIIDVAFRNKIHSGIVVWSGAVQNVVRGAVKSNSALDLIIAQPANDRFKPSVRAAS